DGLRRRSFGGFRCGRDRFACLGGCFLGLPFFFGFALFRLLLLLLNFFLLLGDERGGLARFFVPSGDLRRRDQRLRGRFIHRGRFHFGRELLDRWLGHGVSPAARVRPA